MHTEQRFFFQSTGDVKSPPTSAPFPGGICYCQLHRNPKSPMHASTLALFTVAAVYPQASATVATKGEAVSAGCCALGADESILKDPAQSCDIERTGI